MRLFIAIRFPENIKKALSDTAADLRRQGVRGNFSRSENLHLTLVFLGEVKSPEGVLKAVDRVSFTPVHLELGEGGSFGDLYWVGLKESPELEDYVKRLRTQLKKDGIWFDSKAFNPHITILRKARSTEKIQLRIRNEAFTAAKVSLMKSERVEGKLIYTEIYSKEAGCREARS